MSNARVYVDGGYFTTEQEGGAAFGVEIDGEFQYFECVLKKQKSQTAQVAFELEATRRALNWCINNNIKTVEVCYDYTGIEAWATNKWKAKKEETHAYKKYIEKINSSINVVWQKIKGHQHEIHNIVDLLIHNITWDMLNIQFLKTEALINYLTSVNNILPPNTYLISITASDEQPIIKTQYNRLPLVVDDELTGSKILTFDEASAVVDFITQKIKPDVETKLNVSLIISSTSSPQALSIAEFVTDTVGFSLVSLKSFVNGVELFEPSYITLNKLYTVRAIKINILEGNTSLQNIAYKLLGHSDKNLVDAATKYLLILLNQEAIRLTKIVN